MKKRIVSIVLSVILTMGLFVSQIFAAYCTVQAPGGICGQSISSRVYNTAGPYTYSHSYGFLNQYTCTYRLTFIFYEYVCGAGHASGSYVSESETGHSCGYSPSSEFGVTGYNEAISEHEHDLPLDDGFELGNVRDDTTAEYPDYTQENSGLIRSTDIVFTDEVIATDSF